MKTKVEDANGAKELIVSPSNVVGDEYDNDDDWSLLQLAMLRYIESADTAKEDDRYDNFILMKLTARARRKNK